MSAGKVLHVVYAHQWKGSSPYKNEFTEFRLFKKSSLSHKTDILP